MIHFEKNFLWVGFVCPQDKDESPLDYYEHLKSALWDLNQLLIQHPELSKPELELRWLAEKLGFALIRIDPVVKDQIETALAQRGDEPTLRYITPEDNGTLSEE